MHGDHHIFGVLASHWHELTKKHRQADSRPQNAKLEEQSDEQNEVSCELFLWTKCYEVCTRTHSDSLPCFTMADFDAFLTSRTQNFVANGCGALDLYNDLFGKQDLKTLLVKDRKESTLTLKTLPNCTLELLTVLLSNVGLFLDDNFISKADDSVSAFLEEEFTNPLNPIYCSTSRKKEAQKSIKYYMGDVDQACLSVPIFLRKVKFTMESIEDLKVQVYTEGSTIVMEDLKREVLDALKNADNLLRTANKISNAIDSGNELVATLLTWANYECTLAEVHRLLSKRHELFVETTPFDKIKDLGKLCEGLYSSSQAIAGTVGELEEILTSLPSSSPSFEECSSVANTRNDEEKALVVDISGDSFQIEELEVVDFSDSE